MKLSLGTTIALAVVLIAMALSAQAMPSAAYFCQDDMVITFGALGDPLAAGTSIQASGRLLNWNQNTFAGWFNFTGTASQAGQTNGGVWQLTFDTGTFTITSKPISAANPTGGTTLWTGSIDHFTLNGYVDPALKYDATGYARPAYEGQPTDFRSVGNSSFTRIGGTWTDAGLKMDWLGCYNWNYDQKTPATSSEIFGNLQARLIAPEPASAAALICGSVGLLALAKRKRRA